MHGAFYSSNFSLAYKMCKECMYQVLCLKSDDIYKPVLVPYHVSDSIVCYYILLSPCTSLLRNPCFRAAIFVVFVF